MLKFFTLKNSSVISHNLNFSQKLNLMRPIKNISTFTSNMQNNSRIMSNKNLVSSNIFGRSFTSFFNNVIKSGLKKDNKITKSSNFNFSIDKTENSKEIEDFLQNYESNMKEAEKLSKDLILNINNLDENNIKSNLEQLNNLPIRYSHLEEVKTAILDNIEKIPFTKTDTILQFIQFVDKLDIENFEDNFVKIEKKIRNFIETGKFNLEEIATLIYAFSKYQSADKTIWKTFYSFINGKLDSLSLEKLSQILLAFSMVQSLSVSNNSDLLSNAEYSNLYKQIFANIENKIKDLTYLDTFRICISMTKRPVGIIEVSEQVWKSLQDNFIKEISTFDLYQTSQIILLFCETPYLDFKIFTAVEEELSKEYLDKIDDIIKNEQFNITGLLEDLTKICFSFALSRQGSQFFWNNILKIFIKLEGKLTNLALENLLFVSYRLIDYLAHLQSLKGIQEPDESMKSLVNFFKVLEDKIINNKLLENNLIDPFNAMMPFSRFGNINNKIWNSLIKNLMSTLNKGKSVNPFLLNDIIFAFSNYYMNLILQRDSGSKEDFKNCYYLNNLETIWNKVEELIINVDERAIEIPHLGNMIIDLSSIDLDLPRAWAFLTEHVRERIHEFDANNFVMVLMGFSKKDIKTENVWKLFEEYVKVHIDEFSIEDLRKIIMSFLKHKETNKDFWSNLENRFIHPDVLNKINIEYFIDLQIPFAITGIYNDAIWNKFEELVFRNLKLFENDKDYLMNTIYSFSRSGKGSALLWNKFCTLISKDLNGYDIDDLGHIAVCLKSEYVTKNKLDSILNEAFWAAFMKNVDSKLHTAKLNSLNNLLKGIKENELVNKNEKLVKKIENKIAELFRDIPK